MEPQDAETVASMIADVIDHPVSELYTNPAAPALLRRVWEGTL
jgi:hypothetical protein